mgnify:CR=1 FL=1
MEGPYEDLPEGQLPERMGVGENTGGPSMSFYQKSISILSRFSRLFQRLTFPTYLFYFLDILKPNM